MVYIYVCICFVYVLECEEHEQSEEKSNISDLSSQESLKEIDTEHSTSNIKMELATWMSNISKPFEAVLDDESTKSKKDSEEDSSKVTPETGDVPEERSNTSNTAPVADEDAVC